MKVGRRFPIFFIYLKIILDLFHCIVYNNLITAKLRRFYRMGKKIEWTNEMDNYLMSMGITLKHFSEMYGVSVTSVHARKIIY